MNTDYVQMTKLLLPKMLEKQRGIVVNISSSAGTMNMPMHIVYSATKVGTNLTNCWCMHQKVSNNWFVCLSVTTLASHTV